MQPSAILFDNGANMYRFHERTNPTKRPWISVCRTADLTDCLAGVAR